jgi:AbrB family looped-hinge helix DNA binding protein
MVADAPERNETHDIAGRLLVQEANDLRPKNQLTIPKAIAKQLGLRPGDRLIFEVREGQPNEIRVRRILDNYAGALAGIYFTHEDVIDYLEKETEAWGE